MDDIKGFIKVLFRQVDFQASLHPGHKKYQTIDYIFFVDLITTLIEIKNFR